MDYALVLKTLNEMNCNYGLILEDDAIISHNWFTRIQVALDHPSVKTRLNWSYIKLFIGYKLFDWDWLRYPSIIIKVLLISIFLYLVQYTIIYNIYPKKFSKITFFLIFVNSVALIVVFNATSVNPVGAGLHEYTTGFGTVSVLIPRHRFLNISQFFIKNVDDYIKGRSRDFIAKDLQLDNFRKSVGDVEFVFEPSLVQHIGYFSSVYERDVSAQGYKRMFKSFSFVSHFNPIRFDQAYSTQT